MTIRGNTFNSIVNHLDMSDTVEMAQCIQTEAKEAIQRHHGAGSLL